ncbi:ribonuclease H2 subunit B-like [Mya arenaria]|uniref:ribonuclease H2 subunit B-like n=1 Tax=Mya arenaria TaxID=6604 RepID=UPI0022E05E0B|nr:ribonuclease H2 subunit B-like [Mya arenaria]
MPSSRNKKKALKAEEGDADEDVLSENITPTTSKYFPKTPTQWLFLMNDEITKHDGNVENNPVVAALRHPKTDKKALYVFSQADGSVHELLHFQEECRSWLIEQTVHSDGSLYVTTQVDPVFLVLPYLIKAEQTGKFITLEQIIIDEDFPECERLITACKSQDLHHVSEVKGDDDLMAYKYSQEKTLSWLKLKTERLSRSLSQKNICVSGARAEDLVHSKANHEEYLRYAFGIVSDYLPVDLASRLREHLGIPAVIEKRPSDAANPPSKRIKLEDITPTEDYSKNVVLEKKDSKGKQTTAQKKLEKTDKTGMRSLTAFFSPKPKS